MASSTRYGICTLITNDAYLPGAIALVAALRDLHSRPAQAPEVEYDTLCIVTPETVDVATIKLLRRTFDVVVGVEIIEQHDGKNLDLLGRPDLNHVLTKLHVFRLAQYSKILFLDADVLPIRPLSHLLALPYAFSAVPDVGWPDIFNSGVFVCTPSEASFNELMELNNTKGSWDGGDQGLLNEWRGGDWHRLSFTYNTTPTATYTYAPAYERFGKNITAIHFIGPNKPWKQIPYRAPGSEEFRSQVESTPAQAYDYSALVDRWFAVYDRHYRVVQPPSKSVKPIGTNGQEYAVRRYTAAWDDGTSSVGAEVVPNNAIPATVNAFATSGPPGVSGGDGAPQTYGSSVTYGAPSGSNTLPLSWATHAPGVMTSDQHSAPVSTFGPRTFLAPPTSGIVSDSDLLSDSGEAVMLWAPSLASQTGVHIGGTMPLDDLRRVAIEGFDGAYSPHISYSGISSGGEGTYISLPLEGRVDLMRPRRHSPPAEMPEGSVPWESQAKSRKSTSSPSIATVSYHEHGGHSHRHSHHQHILPHQLLSQAGGYQHGDESSDDAVYHAWEEPASRHQRRLSESIPSEQWPEHLSVHHPSGHHYHYHNHHHSHLQRPTSRPPSPPKVSWNPATEPPPNEPPPQSSFPADTYFPNVWDQPATYRDASNQHPSPSPERPESLPFFRPPPPSAIPETLLRQGHYQNVLGPVADVTEGEEGNGNGNSHILAPQPDPSKVKSIFPWEERPRHIPARVFPRTDSPVPPSVAQYVEGQHHWTPPAVETPRQEWLLSPLANLPLDIPEMPAVNPLASVTAPPPVRRFPSWQSSDTIPSPPIGKSGTLAYSNAWDIVPSIQKYASKLAQPADGSRSSIDTLKFDDSEYLRERDWDERLEAGSRDADDEDEGDDEDGDEGHPKRLGWAAPEEQDARVQEQRHQQPQEYSPEERSRLARSTTRTDRRSSLTRRSPQVHSRSGTGSSSPKAYLVNRPPKELQESTTGYRDIGTQTDVVETRTKGIQVSTQTSTIALARRLSGTIEPAVSSARGSPTSSRRSSLRAQAAPIVGDDGFRRHIDGLPVQSDRPPFQLNHPTGLAPSPVIRPADAIRKAREGRTSPQMPSPPVSDLRTPSKFFSPRTAFPTQSTPGMRQTKLSTDSTGSLASLTSATTEQSGSIPSPLLAMRRLPSTRAGAPRMDRMVSGDTAADSAAPLTPLDMSFDPPGSSTGTPRKAGRVWDPSTGVDVFKRGSEEVLARFLRMGSWEDQDAGAGASPTTTR